MSKVSAKLDEYNSQGIELHAIKNQHTLNRQVNLAVRDWLFVNRLALRARRKRMEKASK